jgi:hypothetical protein
LIFSVSHVLAQFTPEQARAQAREYREAAAQSQDYPKTTASYLRLAERFEALAEALEAEADPSALMARAIPGKCSDPCNHLRHLRACHHQKGG